MVMLIAHLQYFKAKQKAEPIQYTFCLMKFKKSERIIKQDVLST